MIANNAASVTSSIKPGGFPGATTSAGSSGDFSKMVDQSSHDLAAKTQARELQHRKAVSEQANDAASAAKSATEDQAAADDQAAAQTASAQAADSSAADAQAAAVQADAVQRDIGKKDAAQTVADQTAAAQTAATTNTSSLAATTVAPSSAQVSREALQKTKPRPTSDVASAATASSASATTPTAIARADSAAGQQATDAQAAGDPAATIALPGSADASGMLDPPTTAMLTGSSAANLAGATGAQAQSSQASLASGNAAPRISPLSGLRVASPVNVRVTSTTAAAGSTTAAAAASPANAALSAAATTTSNPTAQDSEATTPATFAALVGVASPAVDATGSVARSLEGGVNAPSSLNVAASLASITADTASVAGGTGSSADPGSQDSDQQGAAKVVRDQAAAAKAANVDSDMPDAVLEAAFGGLLAATPVTSTSSDDTTRADASMTSDTISDLASQTAAQAAAPGGVKSFQIVLNPEGLGQVTVSVSIAEDGKLNAAFTFEKPEAAAALSQHAGDLHAALAQSGFDASTDGLSFTAAPQAVAAAPAALQSLSLNLAQDFDPSFAQGFGSGASPNAGVPAAIGSVRDWAHAARQAAGQTASLDVRT